jgi:hypothetical protein
MDERRILAEEELRILSRATIGIRQLGDDETADALTRLHTDVARKIAEQEARLESH